MGTAPAFIEPQRCVSCWPSPCRALEGEATLRRATSVPALLRSRPDAFPCAERQGAEGWRGVGTTGHKDVVAGIQLEGGEGQGSEA